jgi:hypothetical protein
METLAYWLARLEPVIRAEVEDEIIVVFANRCGAEGNAVYAGTSAVLGIQGGEVKVYGILGRGEKELLMVDTSKRPQAKLMSEPTSFDSISTEVTVDADVTAPSAVSTSLSSNFSEFDDEPDDYSAHPISPVDPSSQQTYFDPKRFSGGNEKDNGAWGTLESSITHPSTASPRTKSISAAPHRTESPKSRNVSRNRSQIIQDVREPDLEANDLTWEPRDSRPTLQSPPSSASAVPEQESPRRSSSLGLRSQHVTRPKSAVW